jgi:hypothetical protein
MRTAGASAPLALDPPSAIELWTDVRRWATFVEGFGHTLELADEWPEEGARVVWESTPGGRGRVTEKVVERTVLGGGGRVFATQIFEAALIGIQRLRAVPVAHGSAVELTLEYELNKYGPLRAVADVLFIGRAQRDALRRTLARFAVEAEEEAGLR